MEAEAAPAGTVSAPAAPPAVPWQLLWPGGLFLGYISMDLKRHLRRRGHEKAGRDQAFADLISLHRDGPPPAPKSPTGTTSTGKQP